MSGTDATVPWERPCMRCGLSHSLSGACPVEWVQPAPPPPRPVPLCGMHPAHDFAVGSEWAVCNRCERRVRLGG